VFLKKGCDMRSFCILVSLVMFFSSMTTATASFIWETESNNSMATADDAGPILDETQGGICKLVPGDVDYFEVYLEPGYYMTAVATPMSISITVPDTLMGFMDAQGNLLAWDEDSHADSEADGVEEYGYGSLIQYLVTEAGTYYIAVTGYTGTDIADKDLNFDGCNDATGVPHAQNGYYSLIVGAYHLPEPATLGLIIFGMLFYRRR
jgi:hypothetical protein